MGEWRPIPRLADNASVGTVQGNWRGEASVSVGVPPVAGIFKRGQPFVYTSRRERFPSRGGTGFAPRMRGLGRGSLLGTYRKCGWGM